MSAKTGRPPRLIMKVSQKIFTDWVDQKPTGARLPKENDLAVQYEVNRTTIRSALAFLETENKVVRKFGGGVYVETPQKDRWLVHAGTMVGLSFARILSFGPHNHLGAIQAGLFTELHAARFDVKVAVHDWRWRKNELPEAHFDQTTVRGIITVEQHTSEVVAAFKRLKKPMVAIDYDATSQGVDSFCFDNFRAGAMLARRLVKLGHTQIAALFETTGKGKGEADLAWRERERGFVTTLNELNVQAPMVVPLPQRQWGVKEAERLAKLLRYPSGKTPTAVFIPSGGFFEHVLEVATRCGRKIPEDLSVVGCDDFGSASRLTAVRFDGQDLGRQAAAHLLRMVRVKRSRSKSRKPGMKKIMGKYVAGKTHARAPRKRSK